MERHCKVFWYRDVSLFHDRVEWAIIGWEENACGTVTSNHIDGSVQDCSSSTVLAMELLQSCTKPSISTNSNLTYWPLGDVVVILKV